MSESSPDIFSDKPQTTIVIMLKLTMPWSFDAGGQRYLFATHLRRLLLAARRIAATPQYVCSRHERKKVEMLFAHLKRVLRLDRLRLRGISGANDEGNL
jgi:hypothetical protein